MKRKATIDERRNRNVVPPSPIPSQSPKRRASQEQRARDAASEFFKHYRTPLTITLQSIFGTEFFAQAALLIDPLVPFRNVFGLIALETRYREVKTQSIPSHIGYVIRTVLSSTLDETTESIVPEYIVSDESNDLSYDIDTNLWFNYLQCWDSLSKDRGWDNSYNFAGMYNKQLATYGYFRLYKGETMLLSPSRITFGFMDLVYPSLEAFEQGGYERFDSRNIVDMQGPISRVTSSSIFMEDVAEFAQEYMNQNIWGILPKALSNNKVFNLAYNIAELKDVPQLVRQIIDLRSLISRVVTGKLPLLELDKEIANLNLAWEFGVKSTYGALASLLTLPEKLTKKLNYLIQRNGKVTTGRYKEIHRNVDPPNEVPSFEFDLPDGVSVVNENVSRTLTVELRCVVNQTIQFPSLAVPSAKRTVYEELLGVTDFGDFIDLTYKIFPFSWLVDWFSGLGDYIHVMDAIHSDKQIINFGFLTIVVSEEVIHTCEFKADNRRRVRIKVIDNDDIILSDDANTTLYPYRRVYRHKYQRRVDIGDLEGVKTFGSWQYNLSDFQAKILGSLTIQRL